MFKFNFDLEEEGDDTGVSQIDGSVDMLQEQTALESTKLDQLAEDVSREVQLDDLISALPPTISYSPLSIPLGSRREVIIARRDLFDARFQLISDDDAGTKDGRSELDFVDAPSDLVPGVYEGGLKTWECSLDLVDCLDSIYGAEIVSKIRRKRIIELGCGTAIPSIYVLHSIFSDALPESSDEAHTHIHLQDYNELVLRLVTLPNLILAWYMSPASSAYRSSARAEAVLDEQNKEDVLEIDADHDMLPPADASEPGDLSLTPALIAAFVASLKAYQIDLKFSSGSWATLNVGSSMTHRGPYDILLTSETIYRMDSLSSLVDLMSRATVRPTPENGSIVESLEDATSKISLSPSSGVVDLQILASEPYLCLVAAKLVYFGVGGGVREFVNEVEGRSAGRGKVQTIWVQNQGIKRSVMRVVWEALRPRASQQS